MPVAILLAVLFTASASATGGAISVTSPEHPQTFSYGEVIWHELYVGSGGEFPIDIEAIENAGGRNSRREIPVDEQIDTIGDHGLTA